LIRSTFEQARSREANIFRRIVDRIVDLSHREASRLCALRALAIGRTWPANSFLPIGERRACSPGHRVRRNWSARAFERLRNCIAAATIHPVCSLVARMRLLTRPGTRMHSSIGPRDSCEGEVWGRVSSVGGQCALIDPVSRSNLSRASSHYHRLLDLSPGQFSQRASLPPSVPNR
jgi:hypothetical protein